MKVKDGDEEFNPYQHMDDIISAATSFPNIWAVKKKGEEADDIIATFIQQDYNPWIFSRDNDLLQTQKPFQMFTNVMGNEVVLLDKEEYIREKYELELPFLPIWWKVARGDSSDKIPAGAPRIRKTELIPLCLELKDTQDFEVFMEAFRETKYAERKNALGIDLEADLKRNYDLVMPHYLDLDDLEWRKTPDKMSGYAVCSKYNMVSLSDFYVRV
jgi:5'-3' exonuclease